MHSRKHVTNTMLQDYPLPGETEKIARVLQLRGSNVCEVELPSGEKNLVQIPTRFKKLIWIKIGNFVIINRPPNWDNISYKVKAMIQHVLFPEHVKYIKEHNMWPKEFEVKENEMEIQKEEEEEEEEEDDFLVNPNHRAVQESESEDEDEEEEEDDD